MWCGACYVSNPETFPRTVAVRRGGRKRERREGLGETNKALGVKEEVPIGFPRRKKW
jgi:hypothetical protein